jgi:hypothetical protein
MLELAHNDSLGVREEPKRVFKLCAEACKKVKLAEAGRRGRKPALLTMSLSVRRAFVCMLAETSSSSPKQGRLPCFGGTSESFVDEGEILHGYGSRAVMVAFGFAPPLFGTRGGCGRADGVIRGGSLTGGRSHGETRAPATSIPEMCQAAQSMLSAERTCKGTLQRVSLLRAYAELQSGNTTTVLDILRPVARQEHRQLDQQQHASQLLAVVHARAGQWRDAQRALERGLAASPLNAGLWGQLIALESALGGGAVDRAEALGRAAARRDVRLTAVQLGR